MGFVELRQRLIFVWRPVDRRPALAAVLDRSIQFDWLIPFQSTGRARAALRSFASSSLVQVSPKPPRHVASPDNAGRVSV